MQIRKNLGPSGSGPKSVGNKKTIQIVFRNKNSQQKSSSTTQSNFRGSSSFRTPAGGAKSAPLTNFFNQPNKNYSGKNKKANDSKKNTPKKSTLKPQDDEFSKINVNKILEQEE